MVARQVLVVRYLCRRLFDFTAPSKTTLIREMDLFFNVYSGNFSGQVDQLVNEFNAPFDRLDYNIFDANGVLVEVFKFPS